MGALPSVPPKHSEEDMGGGTGVDVRISGQHCGDAAVWGWRSWTLRTEEQKPLGQNIPEKQGSTQVVSFRMGSDERSREMGKLRRKWQKQHLEVGKEG